MLAGMPTAMWEFPPTAPTRMTAPARIAALAAVAFWLAFAADAVAQGSVATDRAALVALYDATGGAGWTDSTNWKTSAPLDEWYGVTARWPGRVTKVVLHRNGLAGAIPPALGSLANLEYLDLRDNALTGPIPGALGSLADLESLYLSGAGLTGPIPSELGRLVNLQNLNLAFNALTGPIPAELGGLANLEWLELGGNDLTGSIPGALGSLASLERLSLPANALTGRIPGALGSLVNLRRLQLSQNALTGRIPAELGGLANLEGLGLGWNALGGAIPGELGDLAKLRSLGLGRNPLSGKLPLRLTNLGELTSFDVSETDVCIPSDPAFQRWRDAIEARGGRFSGGEPCGPLADDRAVLEALYGATGGASWRNSTNWKTSAPLAQWHGVATDAEGQVTGLNLADNGLAGAIPAALGNLVNLEYLGLDGNGLTGAIPGELGKLADLEGLNLSRNPLAGKLPLRLTNLGELMTFDVSETDVCIPSDPAFQRWRAAIEARGGTFSGGASCDSLAGDRAALEALYDATGGPSWTVSTNWKTAAPLDEWFGVTTDADGVTRLDLVDNGLAGSIPAALGNLVNLEYLGLNVNDLTGRIPEELGNLVNLEELVLSFNDLTGPVPASLGNLARLRTLYVANNALTGPIPTELGRLVNLQVLVICYNYGLTGSIPDELRSLENLTSVQLQGNRLTGPIPPWLGNLTRLRELYLQQNDLSGPIPGELGRLVNLQRLYLYHNELTGPIPGELRSLVNLDRLLLHENDLTGPVPAWLGDLTRLRWLALSSNSLTGPIPSELGSLANLEVLDLSANWGLSGPLPPGLRQRPFKHLDIFLTPMCAPAAWRAWLETIDFFNGRLCGEGTDVTVDAAVVYTPAAREAAGGSAGIEAVIDLMIAETNQAYAASAVSHRVALVHRSEVRYAETYPYVDLDRLADPSDGHLDEVHALRDRVGADLVHLIVAGGRFGLCGIARQSGAFGLTLHHCGGGTFAHELGHNMGLQHDRYEVSRSGGVRSHPAYGYVNQPGLAAGAPPASRWRTVMSYPDQCDDAGIYCSALLRFSNPRQRYNGDPLGVPYGSGGSGPTGPADASAVLDATGPAVALWRDRPAGANQPPVAVGTLPDRVMTLDSTLDVDVSPWFFDPDGDALSHTVSSSAPDVVTVLALGARVTLTAAGPGTATIRVTATDPGGLGATQLFTVTVPAPPNRWPGLVGTLPPVTVGVDEAVVTVEVTGAFWDPDGDPLTFRATSSAPGVAAVSVSRSTVTVTPVSAGYGGGGGDGDGSRRSECDAAVHGDGDPREPPAGGGGHAGAGDGRGRRGAGAGRGVGRVP